MSKSKIKLFNIISYLEDVDKVLEKIVEYPCINVVPADQFKGTVKGSSIHETEDLSAPLLRLLANLEEDFHISMKDYEINHVEDSISKITDEVTSFNTKIEQYNTHLTELSSLYERYFNAYRQVQYLLTLNVSLDDIFSCEYVNARVGKLPLDSVAKLEFYRQTPFVFKSFAEDTEYSWCMYFSTNGYERAVDNIFSSLLFERIYIPDFVHGKPHEAAESLENEIKTVKSQIETTSSSLNEYIESQIDMISKMNKELQIMHKIHQAHKYVLGLGTRCSISGFIEQKDELKLKQLFSKYPDVLVEIRPADSDKRLKAPKKLPQKNCNKVVE